MVVFAVLAAMLILPLAGLIFFRLFENELVRQTESELIAQSAVLAAAFSEQVRADLPDGIRLGAVQAESARPRPLQRYTPQLPTIDLSRDNIKGPRPDATMAVGELGPQYRAIGNQLNPLVQETQKLTLAGFRILDPRGGSSSGEGMSGFLLHMSRRFRRRSTASTPAYCASAYPIIRRRRCIQSAGEPPFAYSPHCR